MTDLKQPEHPFFKTLLKNWQTANLPMPARLSKKAIFLAWLGAFLAIMCVASLDSVTKTPLIFGSLGASCLLVYAYPTSPFAQPRNVIGGHFLATLTGLAVMTLFGVNAMTMAIGVATAIALMLIFRVPHPPAGSNPLIVMLAMAKWDFLFTPTLFGSLIVVGVALIFNNLSTDSQGNGRKYPLYW